MRRLVISCCALALVASACSDDAADSAPTSTSVATTSAPAANTTTVPPTTAPTTTIAPSLSRDDCDPGPTEVRTLVDETRSTPATAQSDELAGRTIDVWIDAPSVDVPVPLLILAHGLTGHARNHEQHRRQLAGECFVVVAPAFPLTNGDVEGAFLNAGDIEGQVGDVSFVIDQILADPDLGPRIDSARIGVIGHSLGGLTTAGAALSSDADKRVSAAVVMAAGFGEARDDIAVMSLHGDADSTVPFAIGEGAYSILTERRIFVTVLGGGHSSGIIDSQPEHAELVQAATSAFFAHELHNDRATVDAFLAMTLDDGAIVAGVPTGPLDDWRDYFEAVPS